VVELERADEGHRSNEEAKPGMAKPDEEKDNGGAYSASDGPSFEHSPIVTGSEQQEPRVGVSTEAWFAMGEQESGLRRIPRLELPYLLLFGLAYLIRLVYEALANLVHMLDRIRKFVLRYLLVLLHAPQLCDGVSPHVA